MHTPTSEDTAVIPLQFPEKAKAGTNGELAYVPRVDAVHDGGDQVRGQGRVKATGQEVVDGLVCQGGRGTWDKGLSQHGPQQ
jgi:hypothetical protein